MFSVFTMENVLAHIGPDGKPYPSSKEAEASAKERSDRAAELGLKVRYVAGPARESA
jgi:hypothetical protein